MASHRMPESERPRRPVPAWVTAPPEDGLEARPAPATTATVVPVAGPTVAAAAPADGPAPLGDVVVPDFPPDQDLLPPAPTSPAVHTLPFDQLLTAAPGPGPAPVSPVDAGPLATPTAAAPAPAAPPAAAAAAAAHVAPSAPAVPVVGQPRFSVPGLEHVVVQGTEPEPTGPVGYRTPARFAGRQGVVAPASSPTAAAAPAFASALVPAPGGAPALGGMPAPGGEPALLAGPPAGAAPTVAAPVVREPAPTEPILQAGAALSEATATDPATTPRLGATPGAVLGAVAGLATLGLAAWWFTAPATVHAVGVLLGVLGLVVSIVVLRDRTATWQRPVALLGAVLGGVGTLVLLWAVASAVLPAAGVTLPDLTGTGTVPTIAP